MAHKDRRNPTFLLGTPSRSNPDLPVAAPPPPPPPPLLDPVAELSPLRMMAGRIARNREVAGLHFPSDSLIGKKLADGSFSIMMERPAVNDLIAAARLESAPRA